MNTKLEKIIFIAIVLILSVALWLIFKDQALEIEDETNTSVPQATNEKDNVGNFPVTQPISEQEKNPQVENNHQAQLSEPINSDDQFQQLICETTDEFNDWQYGVIPMTESDQGWYSQTMYDQMQQAFVERGYPTQIFGQLGAAFPKSDYDFYPIASLQQMAEGGDSLANLKLAQKLMFNPSALRKEQSTDLDDATENLEKYCYQALVDGYSGMSLCMLGSHAQTMAKAQKLSEAQKEAKLVESKTHMLAWLQLAHSEGDPMAAMMIKSFEDDKQKIDGDLLQQRIEELQQKLHKDRQLQGVNPRSFTDLPKMFQLMFSPEHFNTQNLMELQTTLNRCFENDEN